MNTINAIRLIFVENWRNKHQWEHFSQTKVVVEQQKEEKITEKNVPMLKGKHVPFVVFGMYCEVLLNMVILDLRHLVCCSNKKYQLKAITNDQDTILDSSFVDSIRSQSSYYKQ